MSFIVDTSNPCRIEQGRPEIMRGAGEDVERIIIDHNAPFLVTEPTNDDKSGNTTIG